MTLHPEDHRKFWLEKLVKERGFTTGAELGVAEGITYTHLLETCPKLYLLGIDLWQGTGKTRKIYEQYFKDLAKKHENNDRSMLIRDSTFKAHNLVLDNTLDFIFIDALHTTDAVKKDITNWGPKVKKGGVIAGHDINDRRVERAVKQMFSEYNTGPDMIWWVDVN